MLSEARFVCFVLNTNCLLSQSCKTRNHRTQFSASSLLICSSTSSPEHLREHSSVFAQFAPSLHPDNIRSLAAAGPKVAAAGSTPLTEISHQWLTSTEYVGIFSVNFRADGQRDVLQLKKYIVFNQQRTLDRISQFYPKG